MQGEIEQPFVEREMRRLKDSEKEWVKAGKGCSLARVGAVPLVPTS